MTALRDHQIGGLPGIGSSPGTGPRRHLAPGAAPRVAVGAAIAVCVTSLFLPWVRTGFAEDVELHRGIELPVAVAIVSVAVVPAIVAVLFARPWSRDLAIGATLACAVSAGALLVVVEGLAASLPEGHLPEVVQRVSLSMRAGIGLWLAITSSLIACLLLRAGGVGAPLRSLVRAGASAHPARLGGAVALLVVVGVVGWLRYRTWIALEPLGEDIRVQGWALPWLGPLSMVALLGLVAALVACAVGAARIAGAVAAASGWMLTLAAATTIIGTDLVGRAVRVGAIPQEVRDGASTPSLAPEPWFVYGLGLLAAAIGALWIWSAEGKHE